MTEVKKLKLKTAYSRTATWQIILPGTVLISLVISGCTLRIVGPEGGAPSYANSDVNPSPSPSPSPVPPFCVGSLLTNTPFASGSGTIVDPYTICTGAQLQALSADSSHWGQNFKQMGDISLSAYTGTQFTPIGNNTTQFTGTYDGNGHIISDFTYSNPTATDPVGLFGFALGATLKSIQLQNVQVTGVNNVGALVGKANNGLINGCSVSSGTVTGNSGSSVGGLAGTLDAPLYRAFAEVTVSGSAQVGGLVGAHMGGSIIGSYATGSVTGSGNQIGGLIGYAETAVIHTSLAYVYATGDVTGNSAVGGLVGEVVSGSLSLDSTYFISNTFAAGTVTGSANVGGLIGSDTSGGYIGTSFWNQTANGSLTGFGSGSTPGNIVATSSASMKLKATYTAVGWDFMGSSSDGIDDGWADVPANSYPLLWWQAASLPPAPFSGGSGTASDPYLISSVSDLNSIAANPRYLFSAFKLTADLDFTSSLFTMIGSKDAPYSGTFDGNSHTISNLTVNASSSNFVGMFSALANGANVHDLTLSGISVSGNAMAGGLAGVAASVALSDVSVSGSVTGASQCVGGVVGFSSYSTLSNASTSSSVTGDNQVGGLVGTERNVTISNSYHTTGAVHATVLSSNSFAGGLVGYMLQGTITQSYAASSVDGYSTVGGLAGFGTGSASISRSYATGDATSSTGYVGGLLGGSTGVVISRSYATGNVSASSGFYAGGLVGALAFGSDFVFNSYATGAVNAPAVTSVGGLLGDDGGGAIVMNSYASGAVTGSTSVGGLVGSDSTGTYISCFWNTVTTGQSSSAGAGGGAQTGIDTTTMQDPSNFTGAGWDFSTIWTSSGGVNNGFPTLR